MHTKYVNHVFTSFFKVWLTFVSKHFPSKIYLIFAFVNIDGYSMNLQEQNQVLNNFWETEIEVK